MTEHTAALETHSITPIDLLAVNLYPFRETVAKPQVSFEDAIENIDVGGPCDAPLRGQEPRIRHRSSGSHRLRRVLDLLRRGEVPRAVRQEFAAKVFSHTADYDGAIARYLTPREDGMPHRIGWSFERLMSLRYGENPTQRAALYVDEEPRGLRDLKQRQGKELSFNNILDLDAAMWTASLWHNVPACAIIKHTTPCGIAIAGTAEEAFKKALSSDPQSAFGGVSHSTRWWTGSRRSRSPVSSSR
jgi:phosphoribosylaminoimidazolecarboxamide formyltransferase/IMP cyclohydrolase